jgi:uncharacterized repeat protein (TIGR03803 family)
MAHHCSVRLAPRCKGVIFDAWYSLMKLGNAMKAFACICVVVVASLLGASAQAKTWHYTLLHNFCTQDNCADGTTATAGLVADGHGNLFGVTETGGAHNDGVVFELVHDHANYTFKVIHDFCFSCGDGAFPVATLIADVNGNLYGTTLGGGAHDCGIAFMLSPAREKAKGSAQFLHAGRRRQRAGQPAQLRGQEFRRAL